MLIYVLVEDKQRKKQFGYPQNRCNGVSDLIISLRLHLKLDEKIAKNASTADDKILYVQDLLRMRSFIAIAIRPGNFSNLSNVPTGIFLRTDIEPCFLPEMVNQVSNHFSVKNTDHCT